MLLFLGPIRQHMRLVVIQNCKIPPTKKKQNQAT